MLQFSSYTEEHRLSKYQNGRKFGNLINVFESPPSQYAHACLMSCSKFQVCSIDLNVLVIILLAPLTPLVTPPTLHSITGKSSKLVIYLPTICSIFHQLHHHHHYYHHCSAYHIVVAKTPCFSIWSYFSFLFCSSGGYTLPTRKKSYSFKIWREIMCHATMKTSHLQIITIRTMKW